jgi:hypothetical protein
MIVRRTLVILLAGLVLLAAPAVASAATRPAASYYTKDQLQSMSQSWAVRSALSKLTPQERAIVAQAWLGNTPVVRTTSSSSSNFAWGAFGIGASAMLGFFLLAAGFLFGRRYGKHGQLRAHTA